MARTVKAAAPEGRRPQWRPPAKLTALFREHRMRGALLVERDGWLLPRSYGALPAERKTARQGVGLLDIGESGKLALQGDTLDEVLAAAFPDAGAVRIGHAAPGNASGGSRIYRLTREHALVLTAPGAFETTRTLLEPIVAAQPFTHLTDLTGALGGLRLLGPQAPAVLERLCSVDLLPDRFADGTVVESGVARIHTIIARQDSGGLLGYNMYADRDLGIYLWEALLAAGAAFGIGPVGRDVEEEELI